MHFTSVNRHHLSCRSRHHKSHRSDCNCSLSEVIPSGMQFTIMLYINADCVTDSSLAACRHAIVHLHQIWSCKPQIWRCKPSVRVGGCPYTSSGSHPVADTLVWRLTSAAMLLADHVGDISLSVRVCRLMAAAMQRTWHCRTFRPACAWCWPSSWHSSCPGCVTGNTCSIGCLSVKC